MVPICFRQIILGTLLNLKKTMLKSLIVNRKYPSLHVQKGIIVANNFSALFQANKENECGDGSRWGSGGPRTVVVHRTENGFGFTLRHFIVYPPDSAPHDVSSSL